MRLQQLPTGRNVRVFRTIEHGLGLSELAAVPGVIRADLSGFGQFVQGWRQQTGEMRQALGNNQPGWVIVHQCEHRKG